MTTASKTLLATGLFFSSVTAWGQTNACDLNSDGKVNSTDVQSAINMSLGLNPCSANVYGAGVCNVVVVQRVVNASMGGTCMTGTGGTTSHSVTLSWNPSTSSGVTAYKVYRSTSATGTYTLLSSVGTSNTATDSTVASGQTYYYVVTAVSNGTESAHSNTATAVIP